MLLFGHAFGRTFFQLIEKTIFLKLVSIYCTIIKNCWFQICRESIHLLTKDDFKSFGLGIGEMRLLVERFRQDKERTRSESKLRKLIDDVRGKHGVLL